MGLSRLLAAAVVVAAAGPLPVSSPAALAKTALYAAVGAEITRYDVDVEHATIERRESVRLPGNVQEAALHPSHRHLYIAWSNTGPSYGSAAGVAGPAQPPAQKASHGLTAFRLDPASGALAAEGSPARLRARPIHLATDIGATHVLVAYNDPSGVSVHHIEPDGTVGAEVRQPAALDAGIYAHYVRVLPSNRAAVLVTRGNIAAGGKPEDPGALKVFTYQQGALANRTSIAPNGGFGFQARHLDLHPSKPWAFVTLESQNRVEMYRVSDESLGPAAVFSKTTLAEPGNVRPEQRASSVRVHPNGRFVYVANRGSGTTESGGARVSAGGENTIAVFAINQDTGEPTLIQTADTRGFYPRTFAIDGSGRLLVVANQHPVAVREGSQIRTVPASLSVFRIASDGRLTFIRTYEVATDPNAGRLLFWMGVVSLADVTPG